MICSTIRIDPHRNGSHEVPARAAVDLDRDHGELLGLRIEEGVVVVFDLGVAPRAQRLEIDARGRGEVGEVEQRDLDAAGETLVAHILADAEQRAGRGGVEVGRVAGHFELAHHPGACGIG